MVLGDLGNFDQIPTIEIIYDIYDLWERQKNLSMDEFIIFKITCKSKMQEFKISIRLNGGGMWINLVNVICIKVIKVNCKNMYYQKNWENTKFCMCNQKLPIEIGKHNNIEINWRVCTKCFNDLGDEYHCMLFLNILITKKSYLVFLNCVS